MNSHYSGMTNRFKKKNIILAGASSGIGREMFAMLSIQNI